MGQFIELWKINLGKQNVTDLQGKASILSSYAISQGDSEE